MTSTTTARPVTLTGTGSRTVLTSAATAVVDAAPSVADDLRRLGLVATLEAHTWADRSRSSAHLSDLAAVDSRAAYAAWLRRLGAAWARVQLPVTRDAAWPLATVGPECLDVLGPLRADLRDVTLAAGGAGTSGPDALTFAPRPAGAAGSRGRTGGPAGCGTVVGAAYASVVLASDAAVLLPGALALAVDLRAPVGLRFLRRCAAAAADRTSLRQELATGLPADVAEEAVRTAVDVTRGLAEGLTARPAGW
jgi:hypothetical protein